MTHIEEESSGEYDALKSHDSIIIGESDKDNIIDEEEEEEEIGEKASKDRLLDIIAKEKHQNRNYSLDDLDPVVLKGLTEKVRRKREGYKDEDADEEEIIEVEKTPKTPKRTPLKKIDPSPISAQKTQIMDSSSSFDLSPIKMDVVIAGGGSPSSSSYSYSSKSSRSPSYSYSSSYSLPSGSPSYSSKSSSSSKLPTMFIDSSLNNDVMSESSFPLGTLDSKPSGKGSKKGKSKLRQEQQDKLDKLQKEIQYCLELLDNRFAGTPFYHGFVRFYTSQYNVLNQLVDSKGYTQITFQQYQEIDNKLQNNYAKINAKFEAGDSAEEITEEINRIRDMIDSIPNKGMRSYYITNFNSEKPIWEAKLANKRINTDITNEKLKEAFNLFKNEKKVHEALDKVNEVLFDSKTNDTVREQATYINNMIIKFMEKETGRGRDMHLNFGKLNKYENDQINNDVRQLYSKTRLHVEQELAKISQKIAKSDKQESDADSEAISQKINKLRDYIQKQQMEGYGKLSFKHTMIEALRDEATKRPALEGITRLEDWFGKVMSELMTTVNRYNDRIIYTSFNDRKRALLETYEDELEALLNADENSKDGFSQYSQKVQTKVRQILYGIDERMSEITTELANTKDEGTKRMLEMELEELAAKRADYQRRGSIERLEIKDKFQKYLPKIKEQIENTEKYKKLKEKINQILPGFNIENIIKGTDEVRETLDLKVQEEGKDSKEIIKSLKSIIRDLKELKTMAFSKILFEYGNEYQDDLNSYFNKYFDSRIATLESLLADFEDNRFRLDKDSTVEKAEQVVEEYSEIKKQVENCRVPDIYEYYHEQYFNYFRDIISGVAEEYENAEYETIAVMGKQAYTDIMGRLAIIKKKMNTIMTNYKARLNDLIKAYSELANNKTRVPNKQVDEMEKALKDMKIKIVFDSYVKSKDEDYYKGKLGGDGDGDSTQDSIPPPNSDDSGDDEEEDSGDDGPFTSKPKIPIEIPETETKKETKEEEPVIKEEKPVIKEEKPVIVEEKPVIVDEKKKPETVDDVIRKIKVAEKEMNKYKSKPTPNKNDEFIIENWEKRIAEDKAKYRELTGKDYVSEILTEEPVKPKPTTEEKKPEIDEFFMKKIQSCERDIIYYNTKEPLNNVEKEDLKKCEKTYERLKAVYKDRTGKDYVSEILTEEPVKPKTETITITIPSYNSSETARHIDNLITNLKLDVASRNAVAGAVNKNKITQNINHTLATITAYNEEYRKQTGDYYISPVDIDRIINMPAAPPPPPPPKPQPPKPRPMKPKKETIEEEIKPAPVKRKTSPITRPVSKPTTKPRVTFAEQTEIKTETKTTKKKGAKNEDIDVSKMKLSKEMKNDAYEILDLIDKRAELMRQNNKEKNVKIKGENNSTIYAQRQEIWRKTDEYKEKYSVGFDEKALRAYRELHDKPKEETPKEEIKEEKPKTESPKKESPKKESPKKEEIKEEKPKTPKKSDEEEKPTIMLTKKQINTIERLKEKITKNKALFKTSKKQFEMAEAKDDIDTQQMIMRRVNKIYAENQDYKAKIKEIIGQSFIDESPVKPLKAKN